MKTHLLRCESFDGYASLADRLKWVKAGRVLLVMPEKDPPALSRQDFIRLQRQAGKLHADLALVSRDAVLRQTAQSAGLPVFSSNEDAHNKDWSARQVSKPVKRRPEVMERIRSYRARERKPLPGWARWLAFGLAILAILALIAMLLPGAKVELNLAHQNQVIEQTFTARESLDHPDLIGGIPLYKVEREVSAQIEQRTSGRVSVVDKPAEGPVIFTNLTDKVVEIPAGAVVRSLDPALRFEVKESGSLPDGPGTTITLPVAEMDSKGLLGNLPVGSIVVVDPPLGQSLSVYNPQALSGGTLTHLPALSDADIQAGNEAINQELVHVFQDQVTAEIPEFIHLSANSMVVQKVISESTPPHYDQPLTTFQISKTVVMRGYYFLYSDMEEWINLSLRASFPGVLTEITDTPEYYSVSMHYSPDVSMQISMFTPFKIMPLFDTEAIAIQVRSLKPDYAINVIHTLIPGSQPVITLHPNWWPWLPFIPQRIEING